MSIFSSEHIQVMGILNVTPDSFSDGGQFFGAEVAIDHARRLIDDGADILDIGGESTRPGSDPVDEEEELRRVLPVFEALAGRVRVPLSIDTCKAAVARECLQAGAQIINDITGLRDPAMMDVVSDAKAPVIIMHMRGTPKVMQQQTEYVDVVREVRLCLNGRVQKARAAGISDIAIDPGLGFAKTSAQNFELLRRLNELTTLGCPVVVGPSRKSFLGTLPGQSRPDCRLEGTLAAVTIAAMNGARIVRVHDVKECKRAVSVAERVLCA